MVQGFKNSHPVMVELDVCSYSEHTVLNCARDVFCEPVDNHCKWSIIWRNKIQPYCIYYFVYFNFQSLAPSQIAKSDK
jgi:hypothetical protein